MSIMYGIKNYQNTCDKFQTYHKIALLAERVHQRLFLLGRAKYKY
jgi:hypothetical protein